MIKAYLHIADDSWKLIGSFNSPEDIARASRTGDYVRLQNGEAYAIVCRDKLLVLPETPFGGADWLEVINTTNNWPFLLRLAETPDVCDRDDLTNAILHCLSSVVEKDKDASGQARRAIRISNMLLGNDEKSQEIVVQAISLATSWGYNLAEKVITGVWHFNIVSALNASIIYGLTSFALRSAAKSRSAKNAAAALADILPSYMTDAMVSEEQSSDISNCLRSRMDFKQIMINYFLTPNQEKSLSKPTKIFRRW